MGSFQSGSFCPMTTRAGQSTLSSQGVTTRWSVRVVAQKARQRPGRRSRSTRLAARCRASGSPGHNLAE